jgi:hypothetical protein
MKAFDEWLIESEDYQKKSHYASDLTSCKRQQYYNWVNEKKSNLRTPGNNLKMKFGRSMELIFENFLKNIIENKKPIQNKILKNYEKEKKYRINIDGLRYPISCRIDFILYFEDNSSEAIELKSLFGRGIIKISKDNKPKKDYLDQIYIYIKLTPNKKFNHCYFGRDNGYRCEFEVIDHEKGIEVINTFADGKTNTILYEYDMNKIIEKLKDIELAVELKNLPERDYLVAIKNGEIKDNGFQFNKIKYNSDWQCNYCEWKDHCWKNELSKWKDNNSEEFIKRGDTGSSYI